MRKILTSLAVLALAGTLAGTPAHAQEQSRERELLRRAQQALQAADAEKTALLNEKAALESQLKAASEELQSLKSGAVSRNRALEAEVASTRAARTATVGKLDDATRRLDEQAALQGKTAAALTAREADVARLQSELEQSRATEAQTEAKNRQLYLYARELLGQYESKGVWTALAHKEPVLGLGSVEMENLLQEYRDKIDAEQAGRGD